MTRQVHWFDQLGSTMDKAAELASSGCPSGTVVGAEEQTAGRGRHGHSWHSEFGSGLYFSEIIRLPLPSESLPLVTLVLGLAVRDAIWNGMEFLCDLRWPNDVLARGKKCAGILVQLHDSAIIAGMGINVNQVQFPKELEPIATSLRIVTGREHSKTRLFDHLLASIDTFCNILTSDGKEAILRMFTQASSFVNGRHVFVQEGHSKLEGITDGLDPSGFLILRTMTGQRHLVLTGGVRPA